MSFLLVDWQGPSPRSPSPAFLQSGLLLPMLHAEMPDAIRKPRGTSQGFRSTTPSVPACQDHKVGPLSFRSEVILLYWGMV